MCFSEEIAKGVLQHLQENHEQELCRVQSISYARMPIVGEVVYNKMDPFP